MKEAEMKLIADLIRRTLIEKGAQERVSKEIRELTNEFGTPEYCFQED